MAILERHEFNIQTASDHDVKQTKLVELQKVSVERGIDWETALRIYGESNDIEEGFYLSKRQDGTNVGILLAIRDKSSQRNHGPKATFNIYKPNIGLNKSEFLSTLQERFRIVSHTSPKTKYHWNNIFDLSEKMCMHKVWYSKCTRTSKNLQCDFGMRNSVRYILSGSILTIWNVIEAVLPPNSTKLQVVRLTTKAGGRFVGVSIPPGSVEALVKRLTECEQISRNQAEEKEAAKEAKDRDKSGVGDVNVFDEDTDDGDFSVILD